MNKLIYILIGIILLPTIYGYNPSTCRYDCGTMLLIANEIDHDLNPDFIAEANRLYDVQLHNGRPWDSDIINDYDVVVILGGSEAKQTGHIVKEFFGDFGKIYRGHVFKKNIHVYAGANRTATHDIATRYITFLGTLR